MATGRVRRVIDNLLTAAEQAVAELAWDRVLELSEDVLAVEPDNHDASVLRVLAERHVGRAVADVGRRHVTVLYIDLVGSTSMGEQLDPEIYHDVIRAYEAACQPLIDHYGGHVHRFAGDGLVVFFGYPNAHEDDSRRATLTGIEALDALRGVSDQATAEHGVAVLARAGVHTGPAVLGRRGSAGWTGRDDAFGPTVNMASRLQALAAPGTVVVSDTVALLLGPTVELASRGHLDLPGVPRPVEVFDVVGPAEDGLPRLGPARTPLVGRRRELDDLVGRVERARARPDCPGRAVLLRGEAGVGKSRLVDELLDAAAAVGGDGTSLHCSPHLSTSSLHPIRGALHRGAGIVTDDPADARLDKLVHLVERLGLDPGEVVPHLAVPLSIELRGRFDPVELEAAQLKERLLDRVMVVVHRVTAMSTPFVLAVEDVQWADPMTVELLERIVAAGPPSGLLLVATSRPSSSWPGASLPVDVVEVGPLAPAEVRHLAVATAAGPLDEAFLDQVEQRSDGVPLYVSQLVDALTVRGGSSTPDDIPLSLMELLQSRLDSVGSAKAVAQVAATIGREFEVPLLRSVVLAVDEADRRDGGGGDGPDGGDLRAEAVDRHVARLVSSHLVDAEPDDPERLRFHHALVRDAAYASQLLRVRPARHRAVADVLAGLDAAGKPVDSALTAYHYGLAGDPDRALAAYLTAAERAARAGAFDEALSHLGRADVLLDTVPGPGAVRAELAVRLVRGAVVTSLGGWAAEGVMDDYARALELCGKASGDREAGNDSLRALIGIWSWYCTKGDLVRVSQAGEALDHQLRLTPIAGGPPLLASCLGVEQLYAGRFDSARRLLEQSVTGFATDEITDWSRWQIPNDPTAAAYAFLAPLRLLMGDEQAALAAVAAGLERSAGLGFPLGPFSEAFVRAYEAWLHRIRGDLDAAFHAGHELLRIAQKHGFQFWLVVAQIHAGANQVLAEGSAAALDRLGSAIAIYQGAGAHALAPSLLLERAAGCLAFGALDEAERGVDDALSYEHQCYARAEALRLRAEIRAARPGGGDPAAVAGDLCEAFRVATAQPAPLYVDQVVASHRRLVGGDPAPVAPAGEG